eukprot:scpid84627/ scgid19035/ 
MLLEKVQFRRYIAQLPGDDFLTTSGEESSNVVDQCALCAAGKGGSCGEDRSACCVLRMQTVVPVLHGFSCLCNILQAQLQLLVLTVEDCGCLQPALEQTSTP